MKTSKVINIIEDTCEKVCRQIIEDYYKDVKDDRAEVFRSIVKAFSDYSEKHKMGKYEALVVWCDWEELPYLVADCLLALDCDIYGIISDLLYEQEELDEEAREDYNEKMRDYQEMQGWH